MAIERVLRFRYDLEDFRATLSAPNDRSVEDIRRFALCNQENASALVLELEEHLRPHALGIAQDLLELASRLSRHNASIAVPIVFRRIERRLEAILRDFAGMPFSLPPELLLRAPGLIGAQGVV